MLRVIAFAAMFHAAAAHGFRHQQTRPRVGRRRTSDSPARAPIDTDTGAFGLSDSISK